MPSETRQSAGVSTALREQLALITFVVLFAGLVATDTYYAGFGVRFQVLDLAIPHLVYRGLTAALSSPFLIVIYLLAIAWLSVGAERLESAKHPMLRGLVQPATYALVVLIVVAAYFAAVLAGRSSAQRDQLEQSTELPLVRNITNSDGKPLPFHGYRLLTIGSDTMVLFRATQSPAELPFMHVLKREATGEITISRY